MVISSNTLKGILDDPRSDSIAPQLYDNKIKKLLSNKPDMWTAMASIRYAPADLKEELSTLPHLLDRIIGKLYLDSYMRQVKRYVKFAYPDENGTQLLERTKVYWKTPFQTKEALTYNKK
jgi:hypothetical protein